MRLLSKTCRTFAFASVLGTVVLGCATAPPANRADDFAEDAKFAMHWFEDSVNGLPGQIDTSGGFVVFPDVAKWGTLIGGGSWGRGMVCRADGTQVGWAALNTASAGLQAGIEGFRLLVVLEDPTQLDRLRAHQLTGSASATLVAGTEGATAIAPFESGVVVYEGANRGLFAGVNLGLDLIRYEPLSNTEIAFDLR